MIRGVAVGGLMLAALTACGGSAGAPTTEPATTTCGVAAEASKASADAIHAALNHSTEGMSAAATEAHQVDVDGEAVAPKVPAAETDQLAGIIVDARYLAVDLNSFEADAATKDANSLGLDTDALKATAKC